jgi:hypothetical protein
LDIEIFHFSIRANSITDLDGSWDWCHVLWVMTTYFTSAVDCLPILHIRSPGRRCGKTNLVNLLHELVHRPIYSRNISGPAIYRLVELYSPTFLMDEVDSWPPYNLPAIGVLNGGAHPRPRHSPSVLMERGSAGPSSQQRMQLADLRALSYTLAHLSVRDV